MTLAVTVVYADPGVETMVTLALPDTATVAEAVAAELDAEYPPDRVSTLLDGYGPAVPD